MSLLSCHSDWRRRKDGSSIDSLNSAPSLNFLNNYYQLVCKTTSSQLLSSFFLHMFFMLQKTKDRLQRAQSHTRRAFLSYCVGARKVVASAASASTVVVVLKGGSSLTIFSRIGLKDGGCNNKISIRW
jgi:hypothetical protein